MENMILVLYKRCELNLLNIETVQSYIKNQHFDIVIHMANINKPKYNY